MSVEPLIESVISRATTKEPGPRDEAGREHLKSVGSVTGPGKLHPSIGTPSTVKVAEAKARPDIWEADPSRETVS